MPRERYFDHSFRTPPEKPKKGYGDPQRSEGEVEESIKEHRRLTCAEMNFKRRRTEEMDSSDTFLAVPMRKAVGAKRSDSK